MRVAKPGVVSHGPSFVFEGNHQCLGLFQASTLDWKRHLDKDVALGETGTARNHHGLLRRRFCLTTRVASQPYGSGAVVAGA